MGSTARLLVLLVLAGLLSGCGEPAGDQAGPPPAASSTRDTGSESDALAADILYARPPEVTEAELDTLYSRAVDFLSYSGDEHTHPQVAAHYADTLAEKAAAYAESPLDAYLSIAEYDLNGDGRVDYLVMHLPAGEAGSAHEVLLTEEDGAFTPIPLSLTHPGFGVLPTVSGGLHDLIGRATGYRLPLRYDGEAYVYDWGDYVPYRGQQGGALYVEGDYLCQIYSTLYMSGKMDDGMRYYIAARPEPALGEFLEEPLLWAYNPDGSLFILGYTVDEPVLRARLRADADTDALAQLLADGERRAEDILYIKRPLEADAAPES